MRMTARNSLITLGAVTLAAAAACSDAGQVPTAPTAVAARKAAPGTAAGGVYTSSNSASGNTIIAFRRAADGSLTSIGATATGGRGEGGTVDPLQSQYAVLLDADNRYLFVVNAGSNDVSSLRVNGDASVELVDRASSGGQRPVSLSRSGSFLFVLNAGDNSVSTLRVNPNGKLISVPHSTQSLAAGAAGASTVQATPDGRWLIVTERDANRIETFAIHANGRLGAPVVTASNGAVPFGFDITPQGLPIISEAGGAAPNGAVSSYHVMGNGALSVITGSLDAGGKASCWVILTADGRIAFVANSASDAIASMHVAADGSLSLIDAFAGTTNAGAIPIDLDLSEGDGYLYSLDGGSGDISRFPVGAAGTLGARLDVHAGAAASGLQGVAAW